MSRPAPPIMTRDRASISTWTRERPRRRWREGLPRESRGRAACLWASRLGVDLRIRTRPRDVLTRERVVENCLTRPSVSLDRIFMDIKKGKKHGIQDLTRRQLSLLGYPRRGAETPQDQAKPLSAVPPALYPGQSLGGGHDSLQPAFRHQPGSRDQRGRSRSRRKNLSRPEHRHPGGQGAGPDQVPGEPDSQRIPPAEVGTGNAR